MDSAVSLSWVLGAPSGQSGCPKPGDNPSPRCRRPAMTFRAQRVSSEAVVFAAEPVPFAARLPLVDLEPDG